MCWWANYNTGNKTTEKRGKTWYQHHDKTSYEKVKRQRDIVSKKPRLSEPPSINIDYRRLDAKKWNPSYFLRRTVSISDSHQYNFQLSPTRILAVVRQSWFCRSVRAFSGHFRTTLFRICLTKETLQTRKKWHYSRQAIVCCYVKKLFW